jgi:hypothetical protein
MKKTLHAVSAALFLILFIFSKESVSAQGANRVDIGKSFANLSKLSTGGTFNPGDTVEIRVTIAVIKQGTFTTIDSVQVFDQVPAKTTYLTGSMRVATNQGLTYKGPFSENADADAGTKSGNNITINLGRYATGVRGGRIRSDTSKPSFYNSHCIMMACYRVRINPGAVFGDTIFVNGSVKYKMISPANGWTTVTFPSYKILLFKNNGYCPDGSSISATSDNNGTFGSGTTQNRVAALLFGTTYIKQNVSTGQPQDYYYAIVNNSSADGWAVPNAPMPEAAATHRVFGFWDIGGDHTNAANTATGNLPPASGSKAGYFVMVNASYNTNVAYQETLNNLCPNTYYEFSAWYRNLCPRCSCDSNGRGSGTAGFLPYPGNDSSGVRPNLSFEIDGLAYYTTGDIKYDRAVPWKKYGFTFLTKAGQTTANFAIRNNSPGGGGNDWAIDDIKVAHCGPSLTMNYNPILGCNVTPFAINLRDTVRSIYNNYTYFQWQRSNVGGTVWSNMTGPGTSGNGTPVLVNGLWQYVTALPTFMGVPADSGRYYRVIVATTAANLSSPTCQYTDGSSTELKVIDCGTVLSTIVSLRGQLHVSGSVLAWTALHEENTEAYEIERSDDAANFYKVGSLLSHNTVQSQYNFTDNDMQGDKYYRIKIVDRSGMYKYSNIILLSKEYTLEIKNLMNPFSNKIQAKILAPQNGMLTIKLLNESGKPVKIYRQYAVKGYNEVVLDQLGKLNNGIFILSAEFNNEVVRKKLVRIE